MTKQRIREIRAFSQLAPESEDAIVISECLSEIERLQSFTRRGDLPDTATEKGKAELPMVTPTNLRKRARATIEELQAFAKEQEMPASDGEFLFHHFEGKGWKDVKCWKSHFRKWKSANWLPSQKTLPQNGGRPTNQPAQCNL